MTGATKVSLSPRASVHIGVNDSMLAPQDESFPCTPVQCFCFILGVN